MMNIKHWPIPISLPSHRGHEGFGGFAVEERRLVAQSTKSECMDIFSAGDQRRSHPHSPETNELHGLEHLSDGMHSFD